MKPAPRLTTAALFVFAFLLVATNVYASENNFFQPTQSDVGSRSAALPEISIVETTLSINEPNSFSDAVLATVTITLSAPTVAGTYFEVTPFEGTATTYFGPDDEEDNAPGRWDFQKDTVIITPLAGDTGPYDASFWVYGDQVPEDDETFTIRIINAVNVTVGNDRATVTIVDNDDVTVSISDATVTEGSSGLTPAVFQVTLSEPNPGPLPIKVTVVSEAGTAYGVEDFSLYSETLSFATGETTKNFEGSVLGDEELEPDETFYVRLYDAVNATILDGEGLGTILNDDESQITLSISDAQVVEGYSGVVDLNFTITLSEPNPGPDIIFVNYEMSDGTATSADNDYYLVSGSAMFPPGTGTTFPLTVVIYGDQKVEADETMLITFINASGATILDGEGVGTILNDDYSGVVIAPTTFNMTEESAPQAYEIALMSAPSSGSVTIAVDFDASQLSLNGSTTSPLLLDFSSTAPQTVTVDAIANDATTSRTTVIGHSIASSTSPEYLAGMSLADVTVNIGELPPPPPSPTCDTENFEENGVLRTGIPDAIRYAINCRVLYHNQQATDWFGTALYGEANLGVAGLLDLGVVQAVDIFSPPGMTYFDGGAVFCLRGQGSLIWFAASGVPRHAEIIGSYTVPEFTGFTCATLFEPGTLVLVARNPVQ